MTLRRRRGAQTAPAEHGLRFTSCRGPRASVSTPQASRRYRPKLTPEDIKKLEAAQRNNKASE